MIHLQFKNFDEMEDFARRLLARGGTAEEEGKAFAGAEAVPAPAMPALPVPQPIPQPVPVASAPVQPQMPVAPAVPTAQTSYTADDLARAAMMLMDAGRQQELINLLQQFGVTALPDLKPEQYGAFATALRGMGARI